MKKKTATNDASATSPRERILETACELFYREGIRAVGVDTIVAQSGVAKMTLYKHFKSKDELVCASLDRIGAAWRAPLLEGMAECGTEPRQKFDAYFDCLYKWFSSPGFRGCPFINAASEYVDGTHPVRQQVLEHQAFIKKLLTDIARDLGHQDAEGVAEPLLALVEGAIVLAYSRGSAEPALTAKRAAAALLGIET